MRRIFSLTPLRPPTPPPPRSTRLLHREKTRLSRRRSIKSGSRFFRTKIWKRFFCEKRVYISALYYILPKCAADTAISWKYFRLACNFCPSNILWGRMFTRLFLCKNEVWFLFQTDFVSANAATFVFAPPAAICTHRMPLPGSNEHPPLLLLLFAPQKLLEVFGNTIWKKERSVENPM